jgi:L-aminopeptidase/D-esterase-like protein
MSSYQTTPSGLPRARSIGIPFEGDPGLNNAITDVGGVEVGYVTLIEWSGPMRVGEGRGRCGPESPRSWPVAGTAGAPAARPGSTPSTATVS